MDSLTGEIIVTLASKEKHYTYERLGVTFDDDNQTIIDAVAQAVLEEEGVNIKENSGEGIYTVKKVDESKNVYLFPKAVAGI